MKTILTLSLALFLLGCEKEINVRHWTDEELPENTILVDTSNFNAVIHNGSTWNSRYIKPHKTGNYLVWMRRCAECGPNLCPDDPEHVQCIEHHAVMWYSKDGLDANKWNTEPYEAPYSNIDYEVTILGWMELPELK